MINKRLVIIGGGPAGLAAAISAYDNGITDVLIIEREPHLGGILNQCIHNGFGLHTFNEELTGPEYALRYIDEVNKRNISYMLDTTVISLSHDKIITALSLKEGLVKIKCEAVILACGCRERPRGQINIAGSRPAGVFSAGTCQKLVNIDGLIPGKEVVILGSGDIGLIMARRMVLEGAKVLGVAEIMPYSNGLNRNIVQCLKDYDIPLYLSHTVEKVIGKDRLEKIILSPVDENLNIIDKDKKEFEVDTLLLSVGLIPINSLLENVGVKMNPKTKGPFVDENYQTSVKGIFACGNSLHVHDLVDYVTEEGRLAGKKVAKYLKNELTSTNNIEVVNGNNVNYVIPNIITSKDPVNLKFRVKKPFGKCTIVIKNNETEIKRINKLYLLPAEMENIKLDLKNVEDGKLSLEVTHNE